MDQGSHETEKGAETVPLPATADGSGPDRGPNILPGTRYRLDRLLGDGGAGQVYQGIHLELDKPVAIKVLHSEVSHAEDYASRFRREAKAASRINHPGVVAVSDFGTADDGRLFLVMELIEGQTLAEAIQRGPFNPSRALRVAANLCDVLAAIHAAGIVHRDIKPANIFLLDDDRVKVVDFGIARLGALGAADWRITRTGKVVGTPGYMAPEHARAQEVDGRADLYSVGAILYEMLTGVAPFRGSSPVDVLMAQMVQRPDPPSKMMRRSRWAAVPHAQQGEAIPRTLDRVVRRLLAVKPNDRLQSASEVAAILRGILEHLSPASHRRSPPWTMAGERRRIVVIVASTVVVLGLFGGVGLGFWALGAFGGPGAETATSLHKPQSPPIDSSMSSQPNVVPSTDAAPSADGASATTAGNDPSVDGLQAIDDASTVVNEERPPSADTTPSNEAPSSTERVSGGSERQRASPPPPPLTSPPTSTSAGSQGPAAETVEGSQPPSASPAELLQRARIAAASRRFPEAERLFEQAQNAGADQGAVLSGLGQVALARGQHVRAIRLLEQSLALRPGSTRLRLDLGRAYNGAGQTSRAIEQWRTVLQQDPENTQAQRLLRAAGAISD